MLCPLCMHPQVASLEGWTEVMYDAVDATGIDLQPLHNANPAMRVLFVAWVVFGTFFISNLIIGVSIDKVGQRCVRQHGQGNDSSLDYTTGT